ncbi:MAG: hypothetical protein P8Z39_04925 [Gammaproteobacteria bacterium]
MSFDRIPRGVDNAHIDVYLSQQFTNSTRILVRRMLQHDIGVNSWGEAHPPPSVGDLESFEKAYTGLTEAAVSKARKESSPDQIHLLHFAILKYMLMSVNEELIQHRDRLQHARTIDGDQSGGHAVHLHDKLVTLAKEETALKYRITRKLFRHVYKLESTVLRKLRKSVLGRSWPIPKLMLFNPLLQLPSLWAEEQFMHHYSLALMSREEPERFSHINQIVTDVFGYGLPAWAHAPSPQDTTNAGARVEGDSSGMRLRHDRGMLSGFLETELLLVGSVQEDEFTGGLCSWLDDPANMAAILFLDTTDQHTRSAQRNHTPDLKSDPRWKRLNEHLVTEVQRRFRQAGITTKIYAAHEAPKVYKELHGRVPLGLISRYLEGSLSKRRLAGKLSGLKSVSQPDMVRKVLEIAAGRIRNMSKERRQYRIKCFLRDFVVFRRDLKLAYQSHFVMNSIKILLREETIELSRSNDSLQEFVQHSEIGVEKHRIRNHVIIKADLRGSTAITPYQWLCVSLACGLARKIIQVVDTQNVQNRKHGLPELELGLGISFCDGSPTFLYDGDQKIMISPAINRADRLSSCSAVLRRTSLGEQVKRGVEVVVPVDQGTLRIDRSDELLSYNVNGIELDMPAFFKLKTELALMRVGSTVPGYSEHSVFYAGRYPDRIGRIHWLVVREAPVRLWVGNSINTEEEWGRRFYEVITNTDVIAHIKEKVASKKSSETTEPAIRDYTADDSDESKYMH